MKSLLLPLALLACLQVFTGILQGAADDADNNGQDLTRPINRFDTRLQYKSLPDATRNGQFFDDRHEETLTLRGDLRFFSEPNQLAVRIELPLIWNNQPNSRNREGVTEFGLGDLLLQGAYVRKFDDRWAGAVGLQTILPTASSEAFGSGKWQLLPSAAIRAMLPELSQGSYVGLLLRHDFSVAGSSRRKDINNLILEPQFNIGLPHGWFLNSSPQIYRNFETNQWFVPLDLMIGRKFNERWMASVEYQYGLVRDYDRFHQWIELRLGYFF